MIVPKPLKPRSIETHAPTGNSLNSARLILFDMVRHGISRNQDPVGPTFKVALLPTSSVMINALGFLEQRDHFRTAFQSIEIIRPSLHHLPPFR